jgi:predicted RNA binding protein YcfA (HicA-like mRNA interferase family)
MTHKIPLVSGKEMIKALKKTGYSVVRQNGSHIRLKHPNRKSVTVPDHKELGLGLTLRILKDAGLSPKEFKDLLD